MGDSTWELQQAVLQAVRASAAWQGLCGNRFYDIVPEDTLYPYGCMGDDTESDNGTKDLAEHGDGWQITWVAHFWSQYDGRKEVRALMKAARDALHEAPLLLTSNQVVSIRLDFQNVLTEPDGKTQHGVQRYKILAYGP